MTASRLFEGIQLFDGELSVKDVAVEGCKFDGCWVMFRNEASRPLVSNLTMKNCRFSGCTVEGCIIEDSVFDGIVATNSCMAWGVAFKHVVFKGRIPRMFITGGRDQPGCGSKLEYVHQRGK